MTKKINKWKDNIWYKAVASPLLNKFGWNVAKGFKNVFYWKKVGKFYLLNPFVPCVPYLEVDETMFNKFIEYKIDELDDNHFSANYQALIERFFWNNNDAFLRVTKDVPGGENARQLQAQMKLNELTEKISRKKRIVVASMTSYEAQEVAKKLKEAKEAYVFPRKITIETSTGVGVVEPPVMVDVKSTMPKRITLSTVS